MKPAAPSTNLTDDDDSRLESRSEYAYRELKSDLVGGVYGPGQRLTESELCARLQVSRNTLRSVFVRLQEEGLVELELNRGARVRAFTLEEAAESLRIREALECLAVQLITERASKSEFKELRSLLDGMSQASSRGDIMGFTSLNMQFYSTMVSMTKSPELARLLTSLSYSLARFQFRTILVPGRMHESLAEHRQLFKNLQARDGAAAAETIRNHLKRVRAALEQTASHPPMAPRLLK